MSPPTPPTRPDDRTSRTATTEGDATEDDSRRRDATDDDSRRRDGAGDDGRYRVAADRPVPGPAATVALLAATVVTTAGIAAAILVHPGWQFRGHALSDLGATGVRDSWLFNGTLVVAGALGAAGAARLPRPETERDVGRWLAAAGFVLLVGVGLSPEGTAAHAPLAVGFFLVETVGLLVLAREHGVRLAAAAAGAGAVGGVATLAAVPGAAVGETVWIAGFLAAYAALLAPGVRSLRAVVTG